MSEEICSIHFSRTDFKDESGCILPSGHLGPHICTTPGGKKVEWEYDWDCGCENCCTDEFEDMCIVYREI